MEVSIPVWLVLLMLLPGDNDTGPEVSLSRFAAAPNISAPTGIAVSVDGVAYISCDPNGSTGQRRNAGYVVRCEDTNGDGSADRFTRFVENIDSPRGSCWLGDTLYLMQSPFLIAWRDQDGDGVAEERTVLVSGLGPDLSASPIVHGANGVCAAIDGWLYLAIGDQGCFEATGRDGSQVTLHGGGVLRVRPNGSQLEVVCTGTRNLYDLSVDPHLNIVACDNSNDGGGWGTRLLQISPLADYGYPHRYRHFSDEAMPCLADYGAGAATAIISLHESGYPSRPEGDLLSGDYNSGLMIHNTSATPASRSLLSQITKIVGMDADGQSRIYCASRSGGGFGPARSPFGFVDVIRLENPPARRDLPEFAAASLPALVEWLSDPSHVVRLNAFYALIERGPSASATTRLTGLAADRSGLPAGRTAAVFALKRLNGQQSHSTLRPLYQDEQLRAVVVRALGDDATQWDAVSRDVCLSALQDDNSDVRLAGIIGLARSGDPKFASALFPLAAATFKLPDSQTRAEGALDGYTSRVQSHIAQAALVRLQAVPFLLQKLNDRQTAKTALCALQNIHSREVVTGLSEQLQRANDAPEMKQLALALMRLFYREGQWDGRSWWKNRPHVAGPLRQPVRWTQTAHVKRALEGAFHKASPDDLDDLFRALQQHGIPTAELEINVTYDRAMALLRRPVLTAEERLLLLDAATDPQRHVDQQLKILRHFAAGPLPQSYHDRLRILRRWGEGRARHPQQQQAWQQFVSGAEFRDSIQGLTPFLGDSENEAHMYAHLQLLSLLNSAQTPPATRQAAAAELQKTWDEQKKIYPHRLRGLMLALERSNPAPYLQQLQPLIDHRDERVKQPAARLLRQLQPNR